jgi:hypothetical protein
LTIVFVVLIVLQQAFPNPYRKMKRLFIITLVVVGLATEAFAQGYVLWSATPGISLIGVTNSIQDSSLSAALGNGQNTGGGATGQTVGGGSSLFYFVLLVNTNGTATTTPTTLAGLSGWTDTGLSMTNGVNPNGRIVPLNSQFAGSVPYSGSGNENFMLAGWSANLGTTNWASVYNALNNWSGTFSFQDTFFGLSTVGTLAPSLSSLSPTSLFGSSANQIDNPSTAPMELFVLNPVPEPSTIVLAAFSGASLLLFRRRK